jgi:signal transduction histidine kinase
MQAKANILIVADRSIFPLDTSNRLSSYGYTVVGTIDSGEAALKYIPSLLASSLKTDIALIGVQLNGRINGLQTAELVRQRFNIPVLYVSDREKAKLLEAAQISEPYSYILTPCTLEDLCIAVEVTLHKHLTVQRLQNMEDELIDLRSQFISVVSHGFRTPLASILLSAEMLEENWALWTKEQRDKRFKRIKQGILRMAELLDDVSTVGKVEAGRVEFDPCAINLVELCQDIVAEIQALGHGGQKINLVIEGEIPTANADEQLVRYILFHLLSNAIKYSPNGSDVELILKYTLSNNLDRPIADLSKALGTTTFCIQDRGIGIPHKDINRLFDSFYRGSNVGSIAGNGIGLAIAKSAIDIHGGNISVESRVDIGSTFTVTIPM